LLAAGPEMGKISSSCSIGSFPIIQRRKRAKEGGGNDFYGALFCVHKQNFGDSISGFLLGTLK